MQGEENVSTSDPRILTRFRADPSKVRVSVRPERGTFLLTIESRINTDCVYSRYDDPAIGLDMLLGTASEHIEGIDIHMQWSYPHPMGASAVKQSREESRSDES
jgi:hypothetical protein